MVTSDAEIKASFNAEKSAFTYYTVAEYGENNVVANADISAVQNFGFGELSPVIVMLSSNYTILNAAEVEAQLERNAGIQFGTGASSSANSGGIPLFGSTTTTEVGGGLNNSGTLIGDYVLGLSYTHYYGTVNDKGKGIFNLNHTISSVPFKLEDFQLVM
jgi:hypothetical protein